MLRLADGSSEMSRHYEDDGLEDLGGMGKEAGHG